MKIKIVCFMMTLLMILSALHLGAAGGYSTYRDYFPFEDVKQGGWYETAVKFCYVNTYMRGISDTRFDPSSHTTREQMVMILANMTHEDTVGFDSSPFDDIEEGKWYSNAIAWAFENGYTSGIGNGRFGLGLRITREEAVTMFYNYVKKNASEITSGEDFGEYSDAEAVSEWAREAMLWALGSGVVQGNDNKLDPKGLLTRAESAQLIYRIQLNCLMTEHEHEFTAPTCTEPSKCSVDGCFLLLAPAKGHRTDAPQNCESYLNCKECNELVFTPAGHDYRITDCTLPLTCSKCGKSEGKAPGHTTDKGVCERCGKEFFEGAYDKLSYYIKSKGESRGNGKQIYNRVNYSDGAYADAFVGYDHTDQSCFIRFIYRFKKTGDTIEMKIKFKNISPEYTFSVAYSKDSKVIYSGSGKVNASAFDSKSELSLSSYSGKDAYRDDLEKLCAPTLRLMLDAVDHILENNCSMKASDIGFKNF